MEPTATPLASSTTGHQIGAIPHRDVSAVGKLDYLCRRCQAPTAGRGDQPPEHRQQLRPGAPCEVARVSAATSGAPHSPSGHGATTDRACPDGPSRVPPSRRAAHYATVSQSEVVERLSHLLSRGRVAIWRGACPVAALAVRGLRVLAADGGDSAGRAWAQSQRRGDHRQAGGAPGQPGGPGPDRPGSEPARGAAGARKGTSASAGTGDCGRRPPTGGSASTCRSRWIGPLPGSRAFPGGPGAIPLRDPRWTGLVSLLRRRGSACPPPGVVPPGPGAGFRPRRAARSGLSELSVADLPRRDRVPPGRPGAVSPRADGESCRGRRRPVQGAPRGRSPAAEPEAPKLSLAKQFPCLRDVWEVLADVA